MTGVAERFSLSRPNLECTWCTRAPRKVVTESPDSPRTLVGCVGLLVTVSPEWMGEQIPTAREREA